MFCGLALVYILSLGMALHNGPKLFWELMSYVKEQHENGISKRQPCPTFLNNGMK